jgi:23S rRNA (cytosine1962-C5)-methyltransferase
VHAYLTPEAAQRIRHGATSLRREDVVSVDGTPPPGEAVQLLDPDGLSVGHGDLEPEGPIAVRRLGLPDDPAEGVVPRQLRRALQRRAQLVDDPRYCRLVHEDGDGLPGLVVDRFEGHVVVQTTTRAMDARVEEIVRALGEVVDTDSVILRNDSPRRVRAGLPKDRSRVLAGAPPRWIRIRELGARLTIDLHQGFDTGYAYALREVRRTVARLSANARVLDPSCFVGGAVVQAGLHGARAIVAFARDPESSDLAQENIEANGLLNRARVSCCTSPLDALRGLDEVFDLVLLHAPPRGVDQPSWSRELDELVHLSLRATRHGGRLLVAAPDAALGDEPLEQHILRACRKEGRLAFRLMRPASPADFPAVAGAPEALASVVLEIA